MSLGQRLSRRRIERIDSRPRAALALGFAVVAALALPKALASHRGERLPERRAAEWVAERVSSSGRVAAERLRAAYYARADYVGLRQGSQPRTVAELGRYGVQYVIVDAAEVADLARLTNECAPRLSRVHAIELENRRVLVFEVLSRPRS